MNIKALGDAGVCFVATSQGIDVKPDGDEISRRVVTILASVAEFERELITERSALAAAVAVAAGRPGGRRRGPGGPPAGKVLALRRRGASWTQIPDRLECTVGMARRSAEAE